MISIWMVLLYIMADVMQGQGHGGDGAEDPPLPGGFGRGPHEADLVAPQKTRGKAKNKKLAQAVALNKGPLTLPFDRNATFIPVGEYYDLFVREMGIYMWGNIAFDRVSWKNVSPAEKNALHEHLRLHFDLNAIQQDCEHAQLKGGIEAVILKQYRGRKAYAKQHFDRFGGEDDVAAARAKTPEGMTQENWNKAIDFFLSDAHKARSSANKTNRKQQEYTNRGGTATYSSLCYKKSKSRLEAFRSGHTRRDGTFDSALAEERYNELKAEFESQTEPNSEGEFEESSASHPNEVAVFEKVLGTRRGHIRGIGRKPSSSAMSSVMNHHEQEQTPPTFTQAQIASLFQDPSFKEQFSQLMASNKASNKGNEDDSDEGDE